jgi:hypothetical protein
VDDAELERWFEDAWGPPGDRALAEWFRSYLRTFTALAREERDDVEALLSFYGIPAILTADRGVIILTDPARLVAEMGTEIRALRRAGYGSTVASHLHTRRINANSVFLESAWTRYHPDGRVLATFQATYGLTRMPAGWRITSVAVADDP